ncbi:MAG TPA: hypothetical protein VI248_29680 [Kineosporiaceae bacterium]
MTSPPYAAPPPAGRSSSGQPVPDPFFRPVHPTPSGVPMSPSPSTSARPVASPAVLGAAFEGLLRRGLGAAGLLGIALVHLLDLPATLTARPYLGWAHVAQILVSVALAEVLLRRGGPIRWLLAALVAATALLGDLLGRVSRLPMTDADLAGWFAPLALASAFVEVAVLVLAAVALLPRSGQPDS